jgi:uncharacterized SAM-binding protein YcdF (DUF218 family)
MAYFRFFFAFLTAFFFAGAFFLAFFFAIGMCTTPFIARSGVANRAPQNANNMNALHATLQ